MHFRNPTFRKSEFMTKDSILLRRNVRYSFQTNCKYSNRNSNYALTPFLIYELNSLLSNGLNYRFKVKDLWGFIWIGDSEFEPAVGSLATSQIPSHLKIIQLLLDLFTWNIFFMIKLNIFAFIFQKLLNVNLTLNFYI